LIFYLKIHKHFSEKKNNYNICIIYNMPPKRMNMVISNGNFAQNLARSQINIANLAGAPGSTAVAAVTAPSSLNAPILARVHNVRPGCGSCGRH
jgi:hypothetical protein